MRILIDLDEIIVDCLGSLLTKYNKQYNKQLTKADLTRWPFDANIPEEGVTARYINEVGFFRNLDPLPGAIEGVKELAKSHEVIILSSPAKSPTSAAEKVEWIYEYLPFLPRRNYILTQKKHMVKGDIFIDDSPENINTYKEEWPDSRVITLDYLYNREAMCDYRVHTGWTTIVALINYLNSGAVL